MRATALAAAAVCIGLTLGGVAAARVWTDPQGRVTFDAPAGWVNSPEDSPTMTYVITGTANNECHVISIPNANTATVTPGRMRAVAGDSTRFTTETWTRTLNSLGQIFPNDSAQVQSTSVDTSTFWPIQRAEVQSPERPVHAAMTVRPGFDIIIACMTYGGADRTDLYDTFIRSVGHASDAEWQAAAEANPAPAPPPAPAPAN